MGLRLSAAKTGVVDIDEGFDFLGFRIQRHIKEGTTKPFVYTYPSKKALAAIKRKVRTITKQGTNNPLSSLLRQLNAVLRGWTGYFRHGVSTQTFGYLRHYTWWRVVGWLRRKHRRANWKQLEINLALIAESPALPELGAIRDHAHQQLAEGCIQLVELLQGRPREQRLLLEARRLHAIVDGLAIHLLHQPTPVDGDWAIDIVRRELTRIEENGLDRQRSHRA